MKIPLMKHTFLNETETKQALAEFILKAERLSMGEQCAAFEKEFAVFQQRKYAALFNSGGSANLAVLQALKNIGRLKDGDRVGFSALTWSTNVMPILQLGMVPVPVDCNPRTLNAMSNDLRDRIKEVELKAFFITNALGFMADLDEIRDICEQKNMILLEDNCESLGSELPTGKAGNFGLAATTSFFVAHHMSTIEGGMIHTNDEELYEMLTIVRANGWDRNLGQQEQEKWRTKYQVKDGFEAKYTFYELGYNLRPTEITGFLGRQQLKLLEENIRIRQKNYFSLEQSVLGNPDLIGFDHSHMKLFSSFAFPVLCKTAELKKRYVERFTAAGVEVRPMIAGNMQRQPFYAKYVNRQYQLPGTDLIDRNGFYCGNYPELTAEDLQLLKDCLA